MPDTAFLADLARFGPDAHQPAPNLPEARAYCRHLARRHYENFTVASWLLPARLVQPFCDIYAYCRWSDGLADELDDPRESQRLLAWWADELEACYQHRAVHPVFIALGETIRQFQIPREPLADLLVAFRQDQVQARYATWDEVAAYCRYSANPVGRLVLYLAECPTPERIALSDSVCTGLQLANFCQDVANDWDRGRIYLPADELADAGYTEDDFAARRVNEAFRRVMRRQVDRAEGLLDAGWPLVGLMPRDLRVDMGLFIRGGLAILEQVRRADYDVWQRRPRVSKWRQIGLLAQSWWAAKTGRAARTTSGETGDVRS